MVEAEKSVEKTVTTASSVAKEPGKQTSPKSSRSAPNALHALAMDIDRWPMMQAAKIADDMARTIAAIQTPRIGIGFDFAELSRSLVVDHSRMIVQIPEVQMRLQQDAARLLMPIPQLVSYRDPMFEAIAAQLSAAENSQKLLVEQMKPALWEACVPSPPVGLAQLDIYPSPAILAASRLPDLSVLGANLQTLNFARDLSHQTALMNWVNEANAGYLALQKQFKYAQTMLPSGILESATLLPQFQPLNFGTSTQIGFPFQDFLPDLKLDPELTSFLSFHWIVETSLKKLIAFARFYRSRMPKNSAHWHDLTALIVKLEYFLEHLDTLEMLPASVFGNLNTLVAHAMHDLFEIHGELAAIDIKIESIADYWRY